MGERWISLRTAATATQTDGPPAGALRDGSSERYDGLVLATGPGSHWSTAQDGVVTVTQDGFGSRWIELADGVLVRRYAELDLSVGLLIGDHGCLVVDTRSDPGQGAELHAAVREVTRQPCSVVLTHAHFDHCLGTAAFLPATVWAHPRCQEDLTRGGAAQHAEALSWYRAQPVPRDVVPRNPGPVRPVVPDRVVAAQAELDLGGHRVLLMHPGAGHTDHDVVVWSPDTGVLFAGDLIEQGADPDFTDAHPLDWPAAVTELLRLQPRVAVPGHGNPVDAEFVAAQRDALAAVARLCRAVQAGELDATDALRASPFGRATTLAALARVGSPSRATNPPDRCS